MKLKKMLPKIKPAKRSSETNTHFIVVAFGKPYKKHQYIDFIQDMRLGKRKQHPKLMEFSIFDISVPRKAEEEFIKEHNKINMIGYLPRKFVKALQFLLRHTGIKQKNYQPFPYDAYKPTRVEKHKLLSYFPTIIAYRRH